MSKPINERKRPYVPNKDRAVVDGKYAVIIKGKREIRRYTSGQKLEGKTI